ncbi:MAG: ComF family protein [Clostridia bacterium]|nr:ComF family protein [Clostridia bacterium]
MDVKSALDKALFYLSVPKCVCCGARLDYTDNVFCSECLIEFRGNLTRNCSGCFKPLSECSCTTEFLKSKGVSKVIKLFRYIQREESYAANSLIYSLKRENRRDVRRLASAMLSSSLRLLVDNLDNCVFTNVPRRRRAVILRGFDHAAQLSRTIARELGCEYKALFSSKAKKAQKELRGIQRHKNAVFAIKSKADLKGKTLIIVDDVITTGSSIGAASELGKSLGAKRIIACAIGIAYKDEYGPKDYSVVRW